MAKVDEWFEGVNFKDSQPETDSCLAGMEVEYQTHSDNMTKIRIWLDRQMSNCADKNSTLFEVLESAASLAFDLERIIDDAYEVYKWGDE